MQITASKHHQLNRKKMMITNNVSFKLQFILSLHSAARFMPGPWKIHIAIIIFVYHHSIVLILQLLIQMDQDQLIFWIHSNFLYPHCLRANTLSSLRTGVALAEIISDCLPAKYDSQILPHIVITGITIDKSIQNLKIIMSVIKAFKQKNSSIDINLKKFTSEGLYYREHEMAEFIREVIMPLFEWSQSNKNLQGQDYQQKEKQNGGLTTYSSTIAGHTVHQNQNMNNISQLSEIGHHSSMLFDKYKKNEGNHNGYGPAIDLKEKELIEIDKNDEQDQQNEEEERLDPQLIEQLTEWLRSKLKFNEISEPDYVFGSLINAVFCNSRFKDPIIKEAHFNQDSISVYRKGLNFMITNPLAEKLEKQNAIQMLRTIEDEEIIKETQYWKVISDLCLFDKSKGKVQRRRRLSSHCEGQEAKENIIINKQASSKRIATVKSGASKKNLIECKSSVMFNYSKKHLQEAEKWVSEELGYEYSLNKSRKLNDPSERIDNPLLNGSLMGSILMRLKIGKPLLIKNPSSKEQVEKNWDQINKMCYLRQYQSLRKQSLISQHNFDTYLGLLGDLKTEHQKSNPLKHQPEPQSKCNECDHQLRRKINPSDDLLNSQRQELKQWLEKEHKVTNLSTKSLPTQKLTEICGELLNVKIYRETTRKIQESNVEKILGELRRIGMSYYYPISKQKVMDSREDSLRWRIVLDLQWLLAGKVEYCRN